MFHATLYGLSVRLTTDNQQLLDIIADFLKKFYTLKGQAYTPTIQTPDKVFVSEVKSERAFFLHTNQFLHLLHHLKGMGIEPKDATKEDARQYEIVQENYKVREHWVLRDTQVPIVEFLLDKPVRSKMVSLQTGGGKTMLSLCALAKVGHRIGIVILPTFVDQWVKAIAAIHECTTKDVMVVQGSKALRGLVAMARDGELTAKYFIFSNRTLQEFINKYEEDPEQTVQSYGFSPIELFPIIGVGSLLVDETHMHFHSTYKILLHANVRFQVGLSATLISDDAVVSRIHQVVYPPECVYDSGKLDKYIDVYALSYFVPPQSLPKIKTSNHGSKSYSHTAFEQSVSRIPEMRQYYENLINGTVQIFYLDKYEKGDKCMIFVATVKFATTLTQRFALKYPHLKVRRYVEEDPSSNLEEADIIITTVISAGTGLDIPNLRVVVQTVCISSTPANIQNLGRLRKLPDGKDTRFCYLFAENLNKQRNYHYKRLEIFQNRVATHRTLRARAF